MAHSFPVPDAAPDIQERIGGLLSNEGMEGDAHAALLHARFSCLALGARGVHKTQASVVSFPHATLKENRGDEHI